MTSGLGARRVRAIAAAKHHTVAATEGGDVFTWGSNRGNIISTFSVCIKLLTLVTFPFHKNQSTDFYCICSFVSSYYNSLSHVCTGTHILMPASQ